MKIFSLIVLCFVLIGCNSEKNKNLDNLTAIKNNFINSIFDSYIDEGPFQMHYHLRTILFSDNVVSLLGEVFVYDHLPHGWSKFESKTYVKKSGIFKEITLNDLFKTDTQREYLRKTCEDALKKEKISYFSGEQPLRTILNLEDIQNFVVDDKYLIVIFQPYIVASGADDPFIVKISFTELIGKWQTGNPLERQLPINKNFISSWEKDKWISDVQDNHSITYQKETYMEQKDTIVDFGDVQLKKSKIGQFQDGLGAFAKRAFKEGEIVIKWNLKALTEEQYQMLPFYEKENFCHKRNGIIYYYPEPERHVNRSPNPNVFPDFEKEANIALRDIEEGEELSILDNIREDFE